jgi:hypothetical protein
VYIQNINADRRCPVQHAYPIAISVHALATVFWAGTSFALARTGGAGADLLFRPQLGAAAFAILSGAYLWSLVHTGAFGRMEVILAIGIGSALLAGAIQALVAGRALGRLKRAEGDERSARAQVVAAQRIAAGLLAVTTISMVVARYA